MFHFRGQQYPDISIKHQKCLYICFSSCRLKDLHFRKLKVDIFSLNQMANKFFKKPLLLRSCATALSGGPFVFDETSHSMTKPRK